ncbi:hypothetical protein B4099_0616 [Heyndrickxia coagulans]|uniref:Uncharacterized protein n=1 Tax=Heyndrickxia coagulans TaxID=1398 RepID=A0A150KHD7_HEYCO|nr:hypothetical protein B4099_0616 [Heyndrickxia coagulans]
MKSGFTMEKQARYNEEKQVRERGYNRWLKKFWLWMMNHPL